VFQVILELEAKNNLRAHYLYLQTHSPGSAYPERWYEGIRAAIRELAGTIASTCSISGIRHRTPRISLAENPLPTDAIGGV